MPQVLVIISQGKKYRPRWDLNPQPSDPKSDALSITPLGRAYKPAEQSHLITELGREEVRLQKGEPGVQFQKNLFHISYLQTYLNSCQIHKNQI